MQDLPLIKNGFIKKSSLFTIRRGELVRDNINKTLAVTHQEIIKIKGKGGEKGEGACIFYDEADRACTIYEKRPVQCSALKCWDTSEFMRVYRGQKPARKDLIEDVGILRIIDEHEKRCGYVKLEKYVREIEPEGEKSIEKILDLLKFDYQLRPFLSEKLGLNTGEMDFLFGRPLIQTIIMFGLQVIREQDGSFFLTSIKSTHPVR